jgi:hypothetical protein
VDGSRRPIVARRTPEERRSGLSSEERPPPTDTAAGWFGRTSPGDDRRYPDTRTSSSGSQWCCRPPGRDGCRARGRGRRSDRRRRRRTRRVDPRVRPRASGVPGPRESAVVDRGNRAALRATAGRRVRLRRLAPNSGECSPRARATTASPRSPMPGAESSDAGDALVLAAVGREIRTPDGRRTDAIRRLDRQHPAPTVETSEAVREEGGPDAAMTAEASVTTPAVPDLRSESEGFPDGLRLRRPPDAGARRRDIGGRREPDPAVGRDCRTGSDRPRGAESARGADQRRRQCPGGGDRSAAAVDRQTGDGCVDTTWIGRVSSNERVTGTATHRFSRPGATTSPGPASATTSRWPRTVERRP